MTFQILGHRKVVILAHLASMPKRAHAIINCLILEFIFLLRCATISAMNKSEF